MLCVVIKGPTFEDAEGQLALATKYADLVELRLDCFKNIADQQLIQLRSKFKIPMLFTLRDPSQGGFYSKSEEQRKKEIRHLASLKPEYLDLESHLPSDFIQSIAADFPATKLIVSSHDFKKTPEDLKAIYLQMKALPAAYYKIAVTANSSLDSMRMLEFAKKTNDQKLIIMSMGQQEQYSRILGPIFNIPITYASLDQQSTTAPGQLSAQTLVNVYHFKNINPQTAIYALIGDPVDKSISDITHNALFSQFKLNAVYVKIPLKIEEVAKFFPLAKSLGFRGLSVTMPLKETVPAFLDHCDPYAKEIGGVNTIFFDNNQLLGFNTDGPGAIKAIEKQLLLKDKKIAVIGAGGAAKAIIYEACRRGGDVTIFNRDKEKAEHLASRLASKFRCKVRGLNEMDQHFKESYDAVINCTPNPLPINPELISPKALIMDITTRPKETTLLQHARQRGCRIVYGYKMFIEQALEQFQIWFKDRIPIDIARNILENEAGKIL